MISSLKNQFSCCNLSWVSRVCNSATDGLGKWHQARGCLVVFDVVWARDFGVEEWG